MAKGELYRGYIAWKDGTLNIVKNAKESEIWQNREQLEKHLRDRLEHLDKTQPVKGTLRAELEVIHTEILDAEGASDDDDSDEPEDDSDDDDGEEKTSVS